MNIYLDPNRRDYSDVPGHFDAEYVDARRLTRSIESLNEAGFEAGGFRASGDLLTLIHEHGADLPKRVEMWNTLQAVSKAAEHGSMPRSVVGYWMRQGYRQAQREVRKALGDFYLPTHVMTCHGKDDK